MDKGVVGTGSSAAVDDWGMPCDDLIPRESQDVGGKRLSQEKLSPQTPFNQDRPMGHRLGHKGQQGPHAVSPNKLRPT